MSFHAKEGWTFERTEHGEVHLVSPGADVILDADTWSSAVAAVSAPGENRQTWDAAMRLHRGHVHEDSDTEARLRALLARIVGTAYGENTYPGGRVTTEVDADTLNAASDYLGFTRRIGV